MAPPPMTTMQPPMPPMQPPMAPIGAGPSMVPPPHFGGPMHQPPSMVPQMAPQIAAPMMGAGHSAAASAPSAESFNVSLEELQTMDEGERDNCLGTYFYNRLEVTHGQEIAGKIAGKIVP